MISSPNGVEVGSPGVKVCRVGVTVKVGETVLVGKREIMGVIVYDSVGVLVAVLVAVLVGWVVGVSVGAAVGTKECAGAHALSKMEIASPKNKYCFISPSPL